MAVAVCGISEHITVHCGVRHVRKGKQLVSTSKTITGPDSACAVCISDMAFSSFSAEKFRDSERPDELHGRWITR